MEISVRIFATMNEILHMRQVKSSQVSQSPCFLKSSIFVLRVYIMCGVELQTPVLLHNVRLRLTVACTAQTQKETDNTMTEGQ